MKLVLIILKKLDRNFTYLKFFSVCPLQEIALSSFRVCVKDLAGMESQHDPVIVDYAVIGGE